MQRLFLLFHRWIALATGAVIILVALTGSLLLVQRPVARMLHPALWRAAPGASLPLDTLVARGRAALLGEAVTWITLPEAPGRATLLGTDRGHAIWMDGTTGVVQGIRTADARQTTAGLIRALHTSLAAGAPGGTVVLLATGAAVLLVLSGLVVWWPDKMWRIRGGSWKRVVFDLHHLLGITGAAVFLLMTGTGVLMGTGWLSGIVRRLDPGPPPHVDQPAARPGTPMASLDAAARAALIALPGLELRFMDMPRDPTRPLTLALRPPGQWDARLPDRVVVDRYRGTVLQAQPAAAARRGERFGRWVYGLHTGEILGLPAVIVWAVASLALSVNALAGGLMWWNARRAREFVRLGSGPAPQT